MLFPNYFARSRFVAMFATAVLRYVKLQNGPQTIGFHQPSQSFGPVGNGRDQHRSGGHAT